MPRFRIKSVLIATTVIAIWLSTLSGFGGSAEVRAFVMSAILITSGAAALYSTARRRAFWLGFFATTLLMATRAMFTAFSADFRWVLPLARELAKQLAPNQLSLGALVQAISATIIYAVTLVMASVIGYLCVKVYDAYDTEGVDSN